MRLNSKLSSDRPATIAGFRSHQLSLKNSLQGSPISKGGNQTKIDEALQQQRLPNSRSEYQKKRAIESAYIFRREVNTPATAPN